MANRSQTPKWGDRRAPPMRLGIKAHWRDVDTMVEIADRHGATVLEYQMLPGDLETHRETAAHAFAPYKDRFTLRVHQPEVYLGADGIRHFLDISSPRIEERAASVAILTDVAAFAKGLGAENLIIHPGGVWFGETQGGHPVFLQDSLKNLQREIPVLLENMPAHYDVQTLDARPVGISPAAFRIPQGLLAVESEVDGYVLDVSHAYLAVENGSLEVPRALARDLGHRITHVHANGSRGGKGGLGEGTPFSDSDYGVDFVKELLTHLPDDVVVVPEIMDGHKDGGALFDAAFAALLGK